MHFPRGAHEEDQQLHVTVPVLSTWHVGHGLRHSKQRTERMAQEMVRMGTGHRA